MKREDSSIYANCLDEEIRILRIIEFIKIATTYKQRTQSQYNYYGDVSSLSDVAGAIRDMKYTRAGAFIDIPAYYSGPLPTSYNFVAERQPHGRYQDLEMHVTPHFSFDANDMYYRGASYGLEYGNDTFNVHDISGYYTITGIVNMLSPMQEQDPNLEIEYISGEGFQQVKPYTSTQNVDLQGLFRGFKARLVKQPAASLYTSIGCYLYDITIPKYMTNLGAYCFYNSSVRRVTLQADITVLPAYCFAYCGNLTEINIPDTLVTIKNDCFAHSNICNNSTLYLTTSTLTTIEARAFEYCKMNSMHLGKNVSSIGDSAFAMCNNLSEITFQRKTPPTLEVDSTGNATSFYEVARNGKINIPSDASVGLWSSWMSSNRGPYSHLDDYGWSIWQDGVQVYPQ